MVDDGLLESEPGLEGFDWSAGEDLEEDEADEAGERGEDEVLAEVGEEDEELVEEVAEEVVEEVAEVAAPLIREVDFDSFVWQTVKRSVSPATLQPPLTLHPDHTMMIRVLLPRSTPHPWLATSRHTLPLPRHCPTYPVHAACTPQSSPCPPP